MSKCYRCDAEATSDEHVPPKCLFPEQKDLPAGVDYRKNLITVPSCDLHNSARSHDDEYLLCALVSSFENNEAARLHFETKILRLLKKKPWFQETLLKHYTPVILGEEETAAFKVDLKRLYNVLECTAHGLYYYTYREQWPNEVKVRALTLLQQHGADFVRNPLEEKMLQGAKLFFDKEEKQGENQDIFYYQIYRDLEKMQLILRMVFYGGVEVIGLSSPQIPKAVVNTGVDTDAANSAAQVTP